MKKYYSDAAWAKLMKLPRANRCQVAAADGAGLDRAVPRCGCIARRASDEQGGAELATRWMKLVERSTGYDPGVRAGVLKAWQHRQEWPESMQEQLAGFRMEKIGLFIHKAIALRTG